MRIMVSAILLMGLLASCSDELIDDRNMGNEKIFGTVVSVSRTRDVNWDGVGNIASAGATRVGNGVASGVSGGILNGLFGSGAVSGGDASPEEGLSYVIDTDDGQRIKVLASGYRIYYPGDEVMVIQNKAGYSDVYPRDLRRAHPGGL